MYTLSDANRKNIVEDLGGEEVAWRGFHIPKMYTGSAEK